MPRTQSLDNLRARAEEELRLEARLRDVVAVQARLEARLQELDEAINNRRREVAQAAATEEQEQVVPNLDSEEQVDLGITDEEATDETRGLECKICLTNKICVVLSKCGHAFCYMCTTRFNPSSDRCRRKCATCRTPFTDKTLIHLYV